MEETLSIYYGLDSISQYIYENIIYVRKNIIYIIYKITYAI